jgi:tetratricopeptide (TPR) repeat protein
MRSHTFILISLIAVLSCPASAAPINTLPSSSPNSGSPSESQYKRGIEAVARGDYVAADRAFAAALDIDAKYAPAYLGRAEVALQRNEHETALKYLLEASKIAPRDASVHASLGHFYAVRHDYSKAESELSEAMRLDARLTSARMDLADLYATALRQPDRAVELYRQTIAQSPDHAGAHYALGSLLAESGKSAEAEKMFIEAGRLDSANPLPPSALARLELKQNRPDRAAEWIDRALKVDPNFLFAKLLHVDLQFARRNASQALSELDALSRQNPKNVEVQFKYATALHQLGKLPEAFNGYRKVTDLAPNDALAWNNLAALSLDLGKNSGDAVRWAEKAVALAPNEAQFRDTLGWARWKSGQKDGAISDLEIAIKRAPNDPGTLYHLGVMYAESNRKAEAIDAFSRALKSDPQFFASADAKIRLQQLTK